MAGELAKFFVTISSKFDAAGLDATVNKIEELEKKSENLSKGFKLIGGALVAMGAAGTAVLIDLTKSAMESEKAQVMWNQALKQAGTYSDAASKHGIDYANSLQKITTYTDEAILSVETMLTRFGVEGPMLDKLTKATLDLAAAKGMDLSSAADLVAKSVGSDTNALARYGIVIEGTKGSTERMEMAVQNISTLFGGAAQANANTMAGKIEILKNQFDDFKEKLGAAVLPVLEKLLDTGMRTVEWLNSLSAEKQKSITTWIMWGTAIAGTLGPLLLFIAYAPKVALGTTQMAAGFKALWLVLSGPFGVALAITAVVTALISYMDKQKEIQNQFVETGNSLQSLNMIHYQELDAIKAKLKSTKLDQAERDKLELQYKRIKKAIQDNIDNMKGEQVQEEKGIDTHKKAERAWGDLTDEEKKNRDEVERAVTSGFKRTDQIKKQNIEMFNQRYGLDNVADGLKIMQEEEEKTATKTKKMSEENAAAFITMANTIFNSGATIQNTFSTIVDGVSRMFDPVTGAAIQLGGAIISKLIWGKKKPAEVIDENLKAISDYLDSIKFKWGNFAVDIAKSMADALQLPSIEEGLSNIFTRVKAKFQTEFANLISGQLMQTPEYQERMKNIGSIMDLLRTGVSYTAGSGGAVGPGYVPEGGTKLINPYTGQTEYVKSMERLRNTFLSGELSGLSNYLSQSMGGLKGAYDQMASFLNVFDVPAMASGGIVTSPTLAMVGEAGPEAVIPLERMGWVIDIHDNTFSDEAMLDKLENRLIRVIKNNVRV